VPSRMPNAPLSPSELEALRNIASGCSVRISSDRRNMLVGMGLVEIDPSGRLSLTDAGRLRIAREPPAP
jgi:hypothetical protein